MTSRVKTTIFSAIFAFVGTLIIGSINVKLFSINLPTAFVPTTLLFSFASAYMFAPFAEWLHRCNSPWLTYVLTGGLHYTLVFSFSILGFAISHQHLLVGGMDAFDSGVINSLVWNSYTVGLFAGLGASFANYRPLRV
ncbi:MAG: hypothetical protein WC815_21335 [Vicinamibacterales bacterium]|jgi:hypothetical protein